MALESQHSLILTLGKFGILHLCRSTALSEVNKAAKRGVEGKSNGTARSTYDTILL